MSVNTLVKDGLLTNIDIPVQILDIKNVIGDEHKNPGMARDDKGSTWISIRSCVITPYEEKWQGNSHPNHYQNYLHVGKFNEETFEIEGLKLVKPEEEYTGFQWGIEDVRLFWREDGLHGIGVSIPVEDRQYKIRQVEILIDYEAGTYKLLKDHGRPFGHMEKNWSPTEIATDAFDFIYSPTQIVKGDEVIGEDNDLFIHNGSPLVHFEDGYISIAHAVVAVHGERTYASIALKFDASGKLIEHSQFFHFNVGWREGLQEMVEFVSSALWVKGKEGEELMVGMGVKDEIVGVAKLPIHKLKWEPYSDTTWYAWRYDGEPNRVEISS